jgi:anti-repressor protein
MCDYGFEENKDYITINQKRLTAQGNTTTFIDYEITIVTAKQICMLQRTEKGKQCRQKNKKKSTEFTDPYN